MACLAHDDDLVALGHELLGGVVGALDEGAGRVDHLRAGGARGPLDLGRHAVGAKYQGLARGLVWLLDDLDALRVQVSHDGRVVDKGPERAHSPRLGRGGLAHHVQRASHPVAGPGLSGHANLSHHAPPSLSDDWMCI